MSERLHVQLERQLTLSDGTRIFVERVRPRKFRTKHAVATDEANHTVVGILTGTTPVRVTIEPGRDYLGLTEFGSTPSPAAMAAHGAMRKVGHQHDYAMLTLSGHNVSAAESAARSILSTSEAQLMVDEVVSALVEHGTIGRSMLNGITDDVQKGFEVRVRIVHPRDTEQTHTRRLARGAKTLSVQDLPISNRHLPKPTLHGPASRPSGKAV